jgi:hypothetical protein
MSRLLKVVSDFCAWSGMRINREKSVITGFDFKRHATLPTVGILFEGAPLTGLVPDEAFAYLGVRASLVSPSRPPVRAGGKRRRWCRTPCLAAEKLHTQAAAKDIVLKTLRHQYLLCQMVAAMRMVATARFRYSAPLVPWTDASLISYMQCGCRSSGRPGGCLPAIPPRHSYSPAHAGAALRRTLWC